MPAYCSARFPLVFAVSFLLVLPPRCLPSVSDELEHHAAEHTRAFSAFFFFACFVCAVLPTNFLDDAFCRRQHPKFPPRGRRRECVRENPSRRCGGTRLQHRRHQRVLRAAGREGPDEARTSLEFPFANHFCRIISHLLESAVPWPT